MQLCHYKKPAGDRFLSLPLFCFFRAIETGYDLRLDESRKHHMVTRTD